MANREQTPRSITVTVAPDGQTQIEYTGFVGASCLAEGQEFRRRLAAFGVHLSDEQFAPKPELRAALTAPASQIQDLTVQAQEGGQQ